MKTMKKITAAIIAAGMAASMAGCGSSGGSFGKSGSDGKMSIVCTIFPEYDWVREIMGDKLDTADVTCLLEGSADLHSYQPTAEDIMKISTCDLLIYVGGESESWVDDALKEKANEGRRVIDMMEVLGDSAVAEEVKEGMQPEEEEEGEEGEEGEEIEYDEHVWLSVRNAQTICSSIAGELSELDPANADYYSENLTNYTKELTALDADFSTLAESAESKTLIFGDRFPFRYFTEDYGFDYYAAFVGCSAETEASFETITFLANKINELDADTIYTIEGSDCKIANSILDTVKPRALTIATLNSLQSVSADEIKNGATYLSLMRENYDVLKADIG